MPYSCLDHLARLPTLDVAAVCAHDAIDAAAFRAQGVVVRLGTADAFDLLAFFGAVLAGAIVLLRLAAFLHAVGGIAWSARGPIARRFHRPELRTLVERRRGRPADVGSRPADPP